jgi:uncharacterized protein YbaA (DUF1428 family)
MKKMNQNMAANGRQRGIPASVKFMGKRVVEGFFQQIILLM